MDAIELLDIISNGETSKVQFKEKMPHQDALAAEMVAMSNSLGGMILLGVKDKTGEVIGLSSTEMHKYNMDIGNIATNNVKPNIYVTTEVVSIDNEGAKKILVVHINEGINKPFKDNSGAMWVKQGSDKRRVMDNAEILRLFQKGGNLLADEMEVYDTSIVDVNKMSFEDYFNKEFDQKIEEKGLTYEHALQEKKILRNDKLTLAGLLFFGENPQQYKPTFCIKAVSFFGNSDSGSDYRNKPKDLQGTIPILYKKGMVFFESNLKHIQKGRNFNYAGILEISMDALTELLVNALIHRDYLKNAPIRLMIFDDRVEIISPGTLPNNLTIEEIKHGNPVARNPQMLAFSSILLPYSGLGTGIKRALKLQPNIEFINDVEGEQFKVIIPRPEE